VDRRLVGDHPGRARSLDRRCAGGGGSLARGGLLRLRFFGLDGAAEPVGVRLAPDPVRLGVFNRRGVALHADAEHNAEVEGLLIGQPQLTAELVDADLLWQFLEFLAASPTLTGASDRLFSHITAGLPTVSRHGQVDVGCDRTCLVAR
jgi:hypothetical protein